MLRLAVLLLALVLAPSALAGHGHGHHHKKQKQAAVVASATTLGDDLKPLVSIVGTSSSTISDQFQALAGSLPGQLGSATALDSLLGSLGGTLGSTSVDLKALLVDAKQNDKAGAKQDVAEIKGDLASLATAQTKVDATVEKLLGILQNAQGDQLSSHDAALVQVLSQRLNSLQSTLSTTINQESSTLQKIIQNLGG